ncbi:MAG: ComF family protein [Betaproteobacteria bacterium]
MARWFIRGASGARYEGTGAAAAWPDISGSCPGAAGERGRLGDAIARFVRDALDVLLPEEEGCVLCGQIRVKGMEEIFYAPICGHCLSRIPFVQPPYCLRCGRPLRGAAIEGNREDLQGNPVCRDCASGVRFFKVARAVGVYDGALQDFVRAFKFGGRRELAEGIGVLMARVATREKAMRGSEVLVPVPLHPKRLAERGYNQAELLARIVGSCLGLPVKEGLVRSILAGEQNKLGRRERRDNIRGVFLVPHPLEVAGKRVLLVDDVITTGATANECSRALLRAGAAEVRVLAAAVAPLEKEWLRHA